MFSAVTIFRNSDYFLPDPQQDVYCYQSGFSYCAGVTMVIVVCVAFGKMWPLLFPKKMELSKKCHVIRQMFYIFWQNLWYTVFGMMIFLVTLTYALISIPVFGYRWLVVKVLAPLLNPSLGKAVQVSAQYMAAEFLPKRKFLFCGPSSHRNQQGAPQRPQRSVIVCSAVIDGTVTASDLGHIINEAWLTIPKGESELKYPEFQQYLKMWMGFMFWEKDSHFSLGNHLHVHRISEEDSKNSDKCEQCFRDLLENLINTVFPERRSPWEVHLLQNYRDPSSIQSEGVNTVLAFRFHHSMADGFSIMYAVIQGLAGRRLLSIDVASPKQLLGSGLSGNKLKPKNLTREIFHQLVYVPWRILRDAGYINSLELGSRPKSPWYVPDRKKQWKQLYGRSELISVEKIKFIKNQLGASFTGVILSCLAAGAAENLKGKGISKETKFPIYTVVPLPNHPNKLRNHALGTILELDASHTLTNPVERLRKTDRDFQDARYFSQLPLIFSLLGKLMSFTMAPLSRYLCRNRIFPALLTNFPGPGAQIALMGQKCHSIDFCVGGEDGVCGITFSLVSYRGHVRLAVTAEQAVMTRHELRQIIEAITREIDILYERAVAVATENNTTCGKFFIGDDNVNKVEDHQNQNLTESEHIV